MEDKYYFSWGDFFKKNKEIHENNIITRVNSISELEIYNLSENIGNLFFNIKKNKSLFNVIIPCKGRKQNLYKTVESLIKNKFENFVITIVEYSENKEFNDLIIHDSVNYVWVPSKYDEFNKSLCMNIGAMLVDSKYCIFHDLDLYVGENFILSVYENIKNNNIKLIQCFSNLKIFDLNELDTFLFMENSEYILQNIGKFKCHYDSQPPGGSICVEKELFIEVGGYDDNLMENWGSEDSLFNLKLEKITNEELIPCSNPEISVYHIYHEKMKENKNNYNYYEEIKNLDDNLKIHFIENQKKRFLNKFSIIKYYSPGN